MTHVDLSCSGVGCYNHNYARWSQALQPAPASHLAHILRKKMSHAATTHNLYRKPTNSMLFVHSIPVLELIKKARRLYVKTPACQQRTGNKHHSTKDQQCSHYNIHLCYLGTLIPCLLGLSELRDQVLSHQNTEAANTQPTTCGHGYRKAQNKTNSCYDQHLRAHSCVWQPDVTLDSVDRA